MTLYEIYSHAELRRYKSTLVSRATFFQFICILITFIAPFLVAYRSYGFWLKEVQFTEQPNVKFRYEALIIVHDSQGQQLAWSTGQNLNILEHQNLLAPSLSVREVDEFLDGKADRLLLRLRAPVSAGVTAVRLLLLFDFALADRTALQMQSMAVVDYSSGQAGSSLSVAGDLAFKQKIPIGGSRYNSTVYNVPVIDFSSIRAEEYRLASVYANHQQRNYSTQLENTVFTWEAAPVTSSAFQLNATINYPPARVVQIPGFWEVMLRSWVQYVPLLILFLFVLDRVKVFTLQNQIIGCFVLRPNIARQANHL